MTLDNDLKVMLIYDKDTDNSAASMSVSVGSRDSPCDMPGLPHFLEHMLFRGSKKYPKVIILYLDRSICWLSIKS